MDINRKNKNINKKSKVKKSKKRANKISFKTLAIFFAFELFFTGCTFPFLLLYGPFDNAKSQYVGAAMTSMSHQYLATWFLSDKKIAEIMGENSTEETSETTNISDIKVPKVKDDTIELHDIENSKYSGYYLVVKDPTRVKIGVSSKLGVEGETTSTIAENNDAIAAINGGAFTDQSSAAQWTGNGGLASGIVMTGGEVKVNDVGENPTTTFGIDKNGVMVVGDYTVAKLKELGIQEALSFGPALIINGNMVKINGDGGYGTAPKTAIGQMKDGSIILLVIDGREIGSIGATLKELQEIMHQLGAWNAMNLDGGKSTTLYYYGEVRNKPSNSMGERSIPTAVIVK